MKGSIEWNWYYMLDALCAVRSVNIKYLYRIVWISEHSYLCPITYQSCRKLYYQILLVMNYATRVRRAESKTNDVVNQPK